MPHVASLVTDTRSSEAVLAVDLPAEGPAPAADAPEVVIVAGDAEDYDAATGSIVFGIEDWDLDSATESDESVSTASIGDAFSTVLPTTSGVQIVSLIPSIDSPTSYSYSLSVPDGAVVYEAASGALVIEDGNDEGLGKLEAPWAIDASGKAVPTWYEYRPGEIVQVVDHSSGDFEYPIVADPQWSYTHTAIARMGNGALVDGSETPSDVYQELRRCFNCSFPVSGAPRAYPSSGQMIRLNASPFSFINLPAPVRFYPLVPNSRNPDWYFVAQTGHFDGAGSKITFDFYKPTGYPVRIAISATVKVDNGGPANAANAYVAKSTWNVFINNLILNIRRN